MRKLLTILLILCCMATGYAQSTLSAGVQNPAKLYYAGAWTSGELGYIYLPWDYYNTTKTYPVIFFFSGAGQNGSGGTDLPNMLTDGLPEVIDEGHPPYSVDKTSGDTTWFIVVSPQSTAAVSGGLMGYWWTTVYQKYGLRIDTNSIYLTGLSQGGLSIQNVICYQYRSWPVAAAAVSMSPSQATYSGNYPYWANTAGWFFNGDDDESIGTNGIISYDNLHTNFPDADYRLTVYPGGHCCWTTFYDPTWTSGDTTIYDFMMANSFDTTVTPTPPADTASYLISISPDGKFYNGDTVFFQLIDPSTLGYMDSLFDEQNVSVPQTTPTSGAYTEANYPSTLIVDLGGMYKITMDSIYDYYGTSVLDIQYGSPDNWSTDTLKYSTGGLGWVAHKDTFYTRYLHIFYAAGGYEKVREMKFYGHLVGSDSLSRTVDTSGYHKANTTMANFMGVNSYGNVPFKIEQVGGNIRYYDQQSYIDTVTVQHNVDSIQFALNIYVSTATNIPYHFPEATSDLQTYTGKTSADRTAWTSDGHMFVESLKDAPTYFTNLYGQYSKPIDSVNHPDMDATDPDSYDRTARMMWNYAAVFGHNGDISKDSLQVSNRDTTGLGYYNYMETGNEMNLEFKNYGYFNPEEFEAYSSAVYDGNDGTMGSRMGIKTADSSMKVVQAGLAGFDYNYQKATYFWSYYHRPDHKYPFDVINFHSYPRSGGHGTAPEVTLYPEAKKDVGLAHEMCPTCAVWMTEWGYDRNRTSPISVPVIAGKDSAQIQADWIARGWLLLPFTGLDQATLFQIRNDALSKDYDSIGTTQYNTTGLTDGHYNSNTNDFNYYAFPAYYFQKTLWTTLGSYKPDSIIYENHDSIWVYRYKNADNDSVAYAVWSGTQTSRSTTDYAIKTGHASTDTRIITLADKAMYGDTTNATSGTDSTINLTITETPQILFTTAGTDGGTLVDTVTTQTGPTASAGPDQTIRLPTNSVTLAGSATEGTSAISTHVWSKVSGSGGTITTPSSYTSTVTGLTSGTYVLKLVVTDENGLKDSDNVTITVNAAFVGPTAHAGSDQILDPGTTSTTLSGSATAGDGTITGYAWTQVSGTTVTIVSPTSASTSISGLSDGNTYVFRLTVTDSNDLTDSDDVQVTVSSTPPPTGTLTFKWLRNISGHYYLIYENTATGRYYYWKIL